MGATQAGFHVVGAYDIDRNLTYSHQTNFPTTELVHKDIVCLAGEDIDRIIGRPPWPVHALEY